MHLHICIIPHCILLCITTIIIKHKLIQLTILVLNSAKMDGYENQICLPDLTPFFLFFFYVLSNLILPYKEFNNYGG